MQTVPALLAELEHVAADGRVTQKDLARILRCNVDTVNTWITRLEINLSKSHYPPHDHPARFLIESWTHCRNRGVTPYGKTKAVAGCLHLYPSTVPRVAKRLGLVPITLCHHRLRYPIHFWTLPQVKMIAIRTGRLHLLTTTTNQFAPARFQRSCRATAQKPSAGRSRRRPAQNFPHHEHDDIAD